MRASLHVWSGLVAGLIIAFPMLARATDTSAPCAAPTEANQQVPLESPQPTPTSTARVRINELFPNPAGDDVAGEFIELANVGDVPADLTGWTITDAKGKSFTLGTTINIGDFLSLPYSLTKLTLTNSGGTFTLKNGAAQTIDVATYAEPIKEGWTFSRTNDGSWAWTPTPTAGSANIFPQPEPTPEPITEETPAVTTPATENQSLPIQSPTETTTASCNCAGTATAATVAPTEPPSTSLLDAADLPDASPVAVSGVVTLPPGVAGVTLFALQDESAGAFVKVYGRGWPTLKTGDKVALTGKLRRLKNGVRITASAKDIAKIGASKLSFYPRTLAELDATDAGQAVEISGDIAKAYKKSFTVADEDGDDLRIVGAPPTTTDATVTVRGVVASTADGIELLTADASQIVVASPENQNPTKQKTLLTKTNDLALSPAKKPPTVPLALAGTIAAVGVAITLARKKSAAAQNRH